MDSIALRCSGFVSINLFAILKND